MLHTVLLIDIFGIPTSCFGFRNVTGEWQCTRHGDENTETEQRWLHMALMPDITPLPVFLDVRDLMPVMEMADRSLQQMRFETETVIKPLLLV